MAQRERVINWSPLKDAQGWKVEVLGAGGFEVRREDVERVWDQLALHGLKQKIGDAAAKEAGASTAEKLAAMQQVLDSLKRGEWNARGAGAGGLVVEAIARVKGLSVEEALERWRELGEDDREAVRKHPAIKAAMAEIRAERLASAADAGGELPL